MKIAITGKGGVGKTTLAALLAQAWAQEGAKVLAIDVDPVASLAGALGFTDPQNITPLSQMNELVEERTGAKPGTMGQMFKLNPTVDDLPEKIAHEHNGVKLIVMGGIKEGGGGCVCPESALVKALVRHIILQRDEHVIMDMEAGVEHLGRSTADSVNVMIVVVEPGLRSIRAAQQIKDLASQIGIKNIKAVGNKVRNDEDKKFITDNLKDIKVVGFLPFASEIIEADKQGAVEIKDPRVVDAIQSIKKSLQ